MGQPRTRRPQPRVPRSRGRSSAAELEPPPGQGPKPPEPLPRAASRGVCRVETIAGLMSAGQSAQRRADELTALAARAQVAAEAARRTAEDWAKGADGERRVAAELAALGPDFLAVHDRLLHPGRSRVNLDHIVVTSAGVFVLDAKNWSGDVTVHRGLLWVHSGPTDDRRHRCCQDELSPKSGGTPPPWLRLWAHPSDRSACWRTSGTPASHHSRWRASTSSRSVDFASGSSGSRSACETSTETSWASRAPSRSRTLRTRADRHTKQPQPGWSHVFPRPFQRCPAGPLVRRPRAGHGPRRSIAHARPVPRPGIVPAPRTGLGPHRANGCRPASGRFSPSWCS